VTTYLDADPAVVEDAIALGDALVDAWGSWGPNMTPDARAGGVHQRPLRRPPAVHPGRRARRAAAGGPARPALRGPRGGRALGRGQRLAQLRGRHGRRRPHPGVGGAPRRVRRPPHRGRRRDARRARPVDPQRPPLRRHLPRGRPWAGGRRLPRRPVDRPARPAGRGPPHPRPRHLARGAVPGAPGRRARAAVRVRRRPADGRRLQRAAARRHRLHRQGADPPRTGGPHRPGVRVPRLGRRPAPAGAARPARSAPTAGAASRARWPPATTPSSSSSTPTTPAGCSCWCGTWPGAASSS
jgi:hypothetical protein